MDYVPIRVSTLRGDQKIDFNAYIRINEKHVLYLRQGDSFEGERLSRLKAKKLKKMFIAPEDEENYRKYLSHNIEMAYDNNSNKNIVVRSEVIQGAQQSHAEEVFENADSVEAYSNAKDSASRYVDFLVNQDDALTSVLNIENVDQNIAHHGVTVSTLAVALAQKLGIVDPKQTQLLALGGLLHDFGHYHSDLSINRPLAQMTPAELETYKNHPRGGAEQVQTKKHFDTSVINIIMQHEECIDGSGYPNKLMEKSMDPLSVITSSANALDRLMTFEGIPKKDAVKQLMIHSVGKYPLQHIKILGDITSQAFK